MEQDPTPYDWDGLAERLAHAVAAGLRPDLFAAPVIDLTDPKEVPARV